MSFKLKSAFAIAVITTCTLVAQTLPAAAASFNFKINTIAKQYTGSFTGDPGVNGIISQGWDNAKELTSFSITDGTTTWGLNNLSFFKYGEGFESEITAGTGFRYKGFEMIFGASNWGSNYLANYALATNSASPFGSLSSNVTSSSFTPTAVPTPALLPGLIGLGVGVLRKRKAEAAKQTSEV